MIKSSSLLSYLPALWIASIPYGTSAASVFLVLYLISLFFNPPQIQTIIASCKTPWFICLMLFVAWSLLSILWTPEWNHETTSELKKIGRFFLLPILITSFSSYKVQRIAIDGFIIGMLITCLISVIKSVYHLEWFGDIDAGYIFYNHIITGFLCVFAAYCCIEHYLKNDNHKFWYLTGFIFLSIEILLINTGRMAYFLYAALLMYLIFQKTTFRFRIPALILAAITLILIFKFSPMCQERIGDLIKDMQNLSKGIQSTSLGFRWQFYQFCYYLFQKQPWIGHGLGSYGYYFVKLHPVADWNGPPNTHNQYFLILVEQGAIGLVLFTHVFYQYWKNMTDLGRFFIIMLALNSLSDVILNACPGQLFLGIAAISLASKQKSNASFEKSAVKASSSLLDTNPHQWQRGD